MPYRWTETDTPTKLELWPHKSLSPEGFVTFIGITAGMLLIPLLAVVGSAALWGLLPFLGGVLALIWYAIQRNQQDRNLRENLTLTQTELALVRTNPRGPDQSWQANPYWVRVLLDEDGGPVPNYVTLKGSDREVEIGAFLSPEERVSLYHDLRDRLRRLNVNER